PEYATDRAGAARGALLHRAGTDAQDRQALRVGGGRRLEQPAGGDDPGLRLGRRGAARPHWPRLVRLAVPERQGRDEVRRRVLDARGAALERLPAERPDPTPQLVAGTVPRGLRAARR